MNRIENNYNISFGNRYISTARRIAQSRAAFILNYTLSDIAKLTNNISSRRMSFFDRLVNCYNFNNFERPADARESEDLVIQIFKQIRYPDRIHEYLIENFSNSFETINRIINSSGRSRKRLNFANKVFEEIFNKDKNANTQLIFELLESKNSKEYVKHFDRYKSYLTLQQNNPDAVKILDRMVEEGTYNADFYNKTLRKKNIMFQFPFEGTEIFNAEKFFDYYSKANNQLISKILKYFHVSQTMFQNGNDADLLRIIETTTDKNLKLRLNLIETFKSSLYRSIEKETNTHLTELRKLYDKIDEDKNIKSFISKSLLDLQKSDLTIKEVNEILDNISSKKLNIFKNNVFRIIRKTNSNDRISTLKKEITNPLFEPQFSISIRKHKEGYHGKDRTKFIRDTAARIRNFFDIVRYKLTKDTSLNIEKTEAVTIAAKQEMLHTEAAPAAIQKTEIVNIPQINTINTKEILEDKKNISQKSKTDKNALIDTVLDFINKKLGAKTFDRQKEIFSAKATKMRFRLLPEIFASITDTRKADRAAGKLKINSSNADALALYLKINGNNRKFINYLLKKRNTDNTRMFEVKDIISIIDKAETKIAAAKRSNPNYRAQDAREYYNHLYQSYIQTYGKVTRQKKVNVKI